MAYQMDFFGANSYDAVVAAIEAQKVKYPAYVFIRNEDKSTGRLAFMDSDNVLKFVQGEEQKSQVIRVDALPDVSDGDTDVLYIFEDVVYSFNGTEFIPSYKDCSAELEALTERISEVEKKIEELNVADASLTEQITALDEKINTLEIPEECKCIPDNEYEIAKTPVGTLVDYFEKEIRVMIPADTDFAALENGVNGAENMRYIENRIYAPDGAVRYRVNLGGTVTEGAVEDFASSTDEYGRIYLVVCPPVAYLDTTANTWTYYGANSTTSHYIGWNQIVEWYNADGILFACDAIRINLSNEDCHYAIEPYYIGETANELTALQNKIVTLEETVADIESSNITFEELE